MPFELQTPRLRLREYRADDLDFLAALLADPEVMRFYPSVYSREQAQQWLERQWGRYTNDGHGWYVAELGATGEPIGQVALVTTELPHGREHEIGYMFARRVWRQGFASEGAGALRDHARQHRGMERLVSLIRPENSPSQGVARKLGAAIERRTLFHDLWHDVWVHPVPAS